MEKRAFLKLSSALVIAPFCRSAVGHGPDTRLTNWAGNVTYEHGRRGPPAIARRCAGLVRKHARLKVLGTRHCFNRIADSYGPARLR